MSSLRRLRFPICFIAWRHSSEDHENRVKRPLRRKHGTTLYLFLWVLEELSPAVRSQSRPVPTSGIHLGAVNMTNSLSTCLALAGNLRS